MQFIQRRTWVRLTGCGAIGALSLLATAQQPESKPAAAAKPAMTVTVAQPQNQQLSQRLSANGTVAAWQEASVGAEIGGLRLTQVRVNVGDQVTVRVREIDNRGRINLTLRGVPQQEEPATV